MAWNNIYVIDTHSLVWYLEGNSNLSVSAKQALDEIDRGESLGIVPSIVLAEIMHLSDRHRIPFNIQQIILRLQQASNFAVLPLDLITIIFMVPLRDYELHDRVIMATARYLNAPIITKDEQIHASGFHYVW